MSTLLTNGEHFPGTRAAAEDAIDAIAEFAWNLKTPPTKEKMTLMGFIAASKRFKFLHQLATDPEYQPPQEAGDEIIAMHLAKPRSMTDGKVILYDHYAMILRAMLPDGEPVPRKPIAD